MRKLCLAATPVILWSFTLVGCGDSLPGSTGSGGQSQGGSSTNGGNPTTGGSAGSGNAVGGSPGSGGAPTSGGATAGGASTSGGSASGGASGSSGNTSTAGATLTGGTGGSSGGAAGNTNGGSPGKGGSAGTTGGMTASGGMTTSGGTAGSTSGGSAGKGGSGGTTGGSTGTGGSGGLPTVPDNGCGLKLTDTPIGYAAQNGGTIGGGKATPILVNTPADLKTYLADAQPRVLYVMKDLDFRTENRTGVMTCNENTACDNGNGGKTEDPRVSATCDVQEHASTSYRNEVSLKVASNKTVIGIGSGSGAAIRGASLNMSGSQQVILRNLKVYDINPHLVEAGDGITLQGSKFIWLDHLLLAQISDGFVDIGNSAGTSFDDNITLSWIHFDGRAPNQCGGKHHYVNFVDNGRVTYHHNWYDNASGRNPKLGGATTQVHFFNNYWLNITYFCLTTQKDAQARVESNYFENSVKPHWRQTDGNGTAGIAIDSGNVYTGASTATSGRDTGGTVFSVPYTYTKETGEAAKASVVKCSGPQPIR